MNCMSVSPPFRAACRSDTIRAAAMTRRTIDYGRLGLEACEAYSEGPESFADFVRTILSIAAPLHVLQAAIRPVQTQPLDAFTHMSETRH
jgi:hypothetical protein